MTLLFDALSDIRQFDKRHFVSMSVYESWSKMDHAVLSRIDKFRISIEVMDLAWSLRKELKPPVHDGKAKWLEFGNAGSRVGMLIADDGSNIVIGWSEVHKIWLDVAFKPDGTLAFPQDLTGPTLKGKDAVESLVKGRLMLQSALALIQQPRIVEYVPKTYDINLQRSRAKSGRKPLANHSEVVIHVTKREKEAREVAAREIRAGRRLHLVRAHYKTSHGRVIRIAEYWRGDARLGTKTTNNYRVKL